MKPERHLLLWFQKIRSAATETCSSCSKQRENSDCWNVETVFIHLLRQHKNGCTHAAPTMAYFSPDTECFYLLQEPLIHLKIISKYFHKVREGQEISTIKHQQSQSGCLEMDLPPGALDVSFLIAGLAYYFLFDCRTGLLLPMLYQHLISVLACKCQVWPLQLSDFILILRPSQVWSTPQQL